MTFILITNIFLSCLGIPEIPEEPTLLNELLEDKRDLTIIPPISVSKLHKTIYEIEDKNFEAAELFKYLSDTIKCNIVRGSKDVNWILNKLMNGCLNFFLLNDHNAYAAFQKIDSTINHSQADCYTVGFTQLYMMSSILNCRTITSIDVDWRISYAHYQFATSKEVDFEKRLKALDIGEENKGIESFCHKEDIPKCSVAFHEAPRKNPFLQLEFLHEGIFYPSESKDLVVYVSNAIDNEYTGELQFKRLYENLLTFIDRFDKTVWVLYHTGGSGTIAIYKMYKINSEVFLETSCRDDLRYAPSYGRMAGKKYRTHFDLNNPLSAASCLN